MDETMVENHNRVVGPNDKVYMLGDIAFNKKNLVILSRLNGEKVLIKGNHDTEKLSEYSKYFKDVRGSHQFDGIIMTHIPIHPASLARWGCNVHGHLHDREVMLPAAKFGAVPARPDPRYFCVSMELINYTPISLEDAKKQIKNRLEADLEI
jgi:calcineurin-like phosphoesterase family protein